MRCHNWQWGCPQIWGLLQATKTGSEGGSFTRWQKSEVSHRVLGASGEGVPGWALPRLLLYQGYFFCCCYNHSSCNNGTICFIYSLRGTERVAGKHEDEVHPRETDKTKKNRPGSNRARQPVPQHRPQPIKSQLCKPKLVCWGRVLQPPDAHLRQEIEDPREDPGRQRSWRPPRHLAPSPEVTCLLTLPVPGDLLNEHLILTATR